MSVSEEKLAGVDQALADLGKSEAEVTEVRSRFSSTNPVDLKSVDGELGMLSTAFSFDGESTDLHDERRVAAPDSAGGWEDEHTEVEVLDESDFVLLVDENELEELEKAGEDDALRHDSGCGLGQRPACGRRGQLLQEALWWPPQQQQPLAELRSRTSRRR